MLLCALDTNANAPSTFEVKTGQSSNSGQYLASGHINVINTNTEYAKTVDDEYSFDDNTEYKVT